MKTKLLIALLLAVVTVNGQNKLFRNDTIPVTKNGKTLQLPFAGGLNSAHISEIDLDFDGLQDLFIFEPNSEWNPATGDKITTFLKKPDSSGGYRYIQNNEYANLFPNMETFALLRDFNQDGKMDIFTHDNRDRIRVYKNDGDATDGLSFSLFADVLKSSASGYPPTYTFFPEIYWSFEDFISIEDMDGDGDLDILSVDRVGVYMEYHKNVSPSTDTMIFRLKNTCWGKFGEDNNVYTLNTCNAAGNVSNPEILLPSGKPSPNGNQASKFIPPVSGKGSKHSNTSLLAIDLDGDQDKDLLMGDGGFKGLNMLINGGTPTSSNITSVTQSYPPSSPVDLNIYTIPFYQDVDHDNVKDLVVTNRKSGVGSAYESVWMYKNTGTNTNPTFTFQTKSFLQEDMIDVGRLAYPTFFDHNGDGLLDIIIGNHGYFIKFDYPQGDSVSSQLALYENVGTDTAPEFKFVTDDYANIHSYNLNTSDNRPTDDLHPTFGDLDGDGDEDMIIGDLYGKIHYFENQGGKGNTATFAAPIVDFEGIDVGDNAAPQLFDLNRDGKLDLIVGEKDGNLNYFENTGSISNPSFTLVDDSLGNVFVKENWDFWGHSVPFVYLVDSINEFQMIVGSKSGHLFFYDSLEFEGNLTDTFRLLDQSFQNIWEGIFSSISGADINADSSMDFIIGNESGGITLYTGKPGTRATIGIEEVTLLDVKLFPNPTNSILNLQFREDRRNESLRISVYDLIGNEAIVSTPLVNQQLDVSQLSPGVYFIQIQNRQGSLKGTAKFIKQ